MKSFFCFVFVANIFIFSSYGSENLMMSTVSLNKDGEYAYDGVDYYYSPVNKDPMMMSTVSLDSEEPEEDMTKSGVWLSDDSLDEDEEDMTKSGVWLSDDLSAGLKKDSKNEWVVLAGDKSGGFGDTEPQTEEVVVAEMVTPEPEIVMPKEIAPQPLKSALKGSRGKRIDSRGIRTSLDVLATNNAQRKMPENVRGERVIAPEETGVFVEPMSDKEAAELKATRLGPVYRKPSGKQYLYDPSDTTNFPQRYLTKEEIHKQRLEALGRYKEEEERNAERLKAEAAALAALATVVVSE